MNPTVHMLASYSPHGKENGYEGQYFYLVRYYCLRDGINVHHPLTGNALRAALAGREHGSCRFTGL